MFPGIRRLSMTRRPARRALAVLSAAALSGACATGPAAAGPLLKATQCLQVATAPHYVAAGDLNRDGKTDPVVGTASPIRSRCC